EPRPRTVRRRSRRLDVELKTYSAADLRDEVWTPEQEREFDEQEARQDAETEAEFGPGNDDDATPKRDRRLEKAERTIARAADREVYFLERRAEIAEHDVQIE